MASITWKGGSGTWDAGSLWSTGIVPGSTDAVGIAAPGSYTVSITGTADAAGSLTLDAAQATLAVTGTLALATTLAAEAGTLELAGGRIDGGTLALDGAALIAATGTLDATTVLGPLALTGPNQSFTVAGGITLQASDGTLPGTLDLSGSGDSVAFADAETLDNAVLALGTASASLDEIVDVDAGLVLGMTTSATLAGADAFAGFTNLSASPATLENDGSIALTGTQETLNVSLSGFLNTGSIAIADGGELDVASFAGVASTFSNTGVISFAAGGKLIVGSTVDAGDLVGITLNGGTLFLEGAYENAGQTLATTATGLFGNVVLSGGTVVGGTIDASAGSLEIGFGETFDGVTWSANRLSLTESSKLIVVGGLTLAPGSDTLDLSAGGTLLVGDTEVLDGVTIVLGNQARLGTSGAGTLTLGSGALVTVNGSGIASIVGGTVDNAGTIQVEAGVLEITATFSNSGLISVGGGATVDFADSVAAAAIGDVVNTGGTVEIGGTLLNSGATLTIASSGTFSNILLAGTILGGTVQPAGGRIEFVPGAVLDGVTYDGTLDLSAAQSSVEIVGGITLNGTDDTGPGTVLLSGGQAQLYIGSTTTLDDATIVAGNAQSSAADTLVGDQIAIATTLTLGSKLVLSDQGPAAVGTLAGADLLFSGNDLVNTGTMQASAVGGTLDIATAAFSNTGVISVPAGAVLEFGGSLKTANLGSIANAGLVDFNGLLTNTGATLDIAPGGPLADTEFAGEILGGTVLLGGGTADFAGGEFVGVTVDSTLDLSAAEAYLLVSNGIALHPAGGTGAGSVELTGAGANLAFLDSETLDDATIAIGNSASASTLAVGATLTFGPNLTIQETGDAALGAIGGSGAVINEGTIAATSTGGTLTIAPFSGFTNSGLLEIGGGAVLAVQFSGGNGASIGDLTNSGGTFEILGTLNNAGSLLDITAASPFAGALLDGLLTGGTVAMDGGTLDYAGGVNGIGGGTLSAVTVLGALDLSTAAAMLLLEHGVTLLAEGDTASSVNLTGAGADLIVGDSETLADASFAIGNANSADSVRIDSTLTLGAGLTLSETTDDAHASIDGVTLINQGTIAAAAAGGALTIGVGAFIGGAGTLEIGAGALLSVTASGGLASLGAILNSGGTLGLTGTIANTGSTLVIASTGSLSDVLLNGTIDGGTVELAGGVLQFGSLAAFVDVTFIGATIDLDTAGAGLWIHDGTTLSSGSASPLVISVTGPPTKFLNLDGGVTLSDAVIDVSGSSQQLDVGLLAPGTVSLAASTSIEIAADSRVILGSDIDSAVFADAGTIAVAGAGTLALDGPEVLDTGTVALDAGAVLQVIDTSLSTTGWIGSIGGTDGTLQVAEAALDLAGGTLSLSASAPFTTLQNTGTVADGTVINAGTYEAGTSVLQDITFDGLLDLSAPAQREVEEEGLSLFGLDGNSPGSVDLTGLGSQLQFEDIATLDHATVMLGGGPGDYEGTTQDTAITFVSDLTFGAGLAIDATTIGAVSQIYGRGTLTTAATISVGAGAALTIELPGNFGGNNFVNTGAISLAAGGTLAVDAITTTGNLATIANAGGTLLLGGVLNNTGATITVGPSGVFSDLVLGAPSLLVDGGAIADAGGSLAFAGSDIFDDVQYSGPLDVGNGADVTFASTSTLVPGAVSIDGDAVLTLPTLAAGQNVAAASGLFADAGGGSASGSFAFHGDATLELGTPAGFLTPIFGFGPGSTIALEDTAATGLGYADGTLSVQDGTITVATLQVGTGYSLQDFGFVEVGGGTDITTSKFACFAAGTRILTARGEVPVENLRVGDRALTGSGHARPIVWLGHRRIDCRRHARPRDIWPMCVQAGAFGPGRPRRDVWLSPDHAVFTDGVLVPIRCLANASSIAQAPRDEVVYWHVELDRHDVMLAEGLPCESFLDTGNRDAFENGGGAVQFHPDFALRLWDGDACAPLVVGGRRLEQVRAKLGERMPGAAMRGQSIRSCSARQAPAKPAAAA